jgi:hypothetical protein
MDLLKTILDLVVGLLTKKEIDLNTEVPIGNDSASQPQAQVHQDPPTVAIDWTNPDQKLSKYFTVKEMIYLPTWKRMANESDGLNEQIKENLLKLAQKMDTVREYFGKPINVHVTYRPLEYNKAIGGALHSAHTDGMAMDFDISGMTCDQVREELVSKGLLDQWAMRCEKRPGSNWVHLDYRSLLPGGNRYFLP